jgi:hypothetical protein
VGANNRSIMNKQNMTREDQGVACEDRGKKNMTMIQALNIELD